MSPLFPLIQSDLDLNGPILSFSTQPVGTSCSVASGIATFIGIATATFPSGQTERETNTGEISYQWYKGSTALTDGTNVTGSGTTTLTLSGLTSPSDNNTVVFLQADYTPNALSPNAINEPLNSDNATLTVLPTISIDTQPVDVTVVEDIESSFSIVASTSDDSVGLGYQWYLNGSQISGATSPTLSITRPDPGLDKVYCEVSHPTAQPGIVTSTEATINVITSRTFIQWELIGDGTRQAKGERDLASAGPFSQRARVNIGARIIQLFSPEKDIDVKVTLGAAAGANSNSGHRGGEGGISVFKMTLKQNTEYTVKLGVNSYQGGGPRGGIHGGGGLAVIYEKARVLAVCGGGGGAGTGGGGGDGGGCNVAGEQNRVGEIGAAGGLHIRVDELPSTGMTQAGNTRPSDFNNENEGSGRLSGCTIGGHWRRQGKAPCEDVGTGVALLKNDGGVLSDTTNTTTGPITRGYKAGQGHRNNGGAGSGNGGGGGAGARGGEGNTNNGGGGGASGYYTSQVELLSSTTLPNGTRLGGNDDVAFICVEAYNPSLDGQQEPCIPPKSNSDVERTVEWTITRSTAENVSCVFTRETAPETGPTQLIFGPGAETKTSQISRGAVYRLTTRNNVDRLTIDRSIPQGILTLSDLDFNPGSLSITPSLGRFEVENVNNIQEATWTANW